MSITLGGGNDEIRIASGASGSIELFDDAGSLEEVTLVTDFGVGADTLVATGGTYLPPSAWLFIGFAETGEAYFSTVAAFNLANNQADRFTAFDVADGSGAYIDNVVGAGPDDFYVKLAGDELRLTGGAITRA